MKKRVHPDPQKAEDNKILESPANEVELQHVLGMVTYMVPSMTAMISSCLQNTGAFTISPP